MSQLHSLEEFFHVHLPLLVSHGSALLPSARLCACNRKARPALPLILQLGQHEVLEEAQK